MTRQYRPAPSRPVVATAKECHSPLAADPDEFPRSAPSRQRGHDHLAGDREELGRQAANAQPGVRHEHDEDDQEQHGRLAEQSGQARAGRQRPGRLDGNDDREDAQCRPAAEPVDRLEAVVPEVAHPVPGGARHDDQDREQAGGRQARDGGGQLGERRRGREPGHARHRHDAVQLPEVVGQLVQPVLRDQPAQHEYRDAERRQGSLDGPAADPTLAR
jgi:hypothetical protein